MQGGTHDVAAYDAYAHGLQQIAIDSFASLDAAERAMQQALARDPNYLDAMVGLVRVEMLMTQTGKIPKRTARLRARPWLARIEQHRSGQRAVARGACGVGGRGGRVRCFAALAGAGDRARAQRYVAAYDAGAATTCTTWNSNRRWRSVEAVLQLDPLNGSLYFLKTSALLWLGRIDEAEASARRGWQLQPQNPNAASAMAGVAAFRNDLASYVRWDLVAHRIDPDDHEIIAEMVPYLQDLGEPAAADAWLLVSQRLAPGNLFAEGQSRRARQCARQRTGRLRRRHRADPARSRGAPLELDHRHGRGLPCSGGTRALGADAPGARARGRAARALRRRRLPRTRARTAHRSTRRSGDFRRWRRAWPSRATGRRDARSCWPR